MEVRSDLSIVAIIPLYNGARWIEQAINSVLSQTVVCDEVIVVDDGSSDDGAGAAIVEHMARKHPIIKLLRKSNGGQSSARNLGVTHSRSALIAFLDQDDSWYPNHLEVLIRPFRKPRPIPVGWAYSNVDEIDEGGGLVNKRFLDLLHQENPKRSLAVSLRNDLFILPSASLISREAFESVGGFDERLCGYEDDDLFLRLFRAGYDNVFVDKSLSKWRIYKTSTSYTHRMLTSRMIYAMKLFKQFPDEPERSIYFSRDFIGPRFLHQTIASCMTAIVRRDIEMFRLAVSHLKILSPYLSLRYRLGLAAGLMIFGQYSLAAGAYRVRGLLRPVARWLMVP